MESDSTTIKYEDGIIYDNIQYNESKSTCSSPQRGTSKNNDRNKNGKKEDSNIQTENTNNDEIYYETVHNNPPLIVMDDTHITNIQHILSNNHKNETKNNTPNVLYDEISISTKDSMGPTAFIEPIFDLQQQQHHSLHTTTTGCHDGGEKIYDPKDGNDSIRDSECVQMYPTQDHNEKEDNVENYQEHDDLDEKLLSENQGGELCEEKNEGEEEEAESNPSSTSTLSYNSFQRIARRAFLRTKVEKQRQNLTSKMTILNAKNAQEASDKGCVNNDHDEGGKFQDKTNVQPNNVTDVDEGVFHGLGQLMCNNDEDNNIQDKKISTQSTTARGLDEAPEAINSVPSMKCALHFIITMSFILNVYNYFFYPSEESEDIIEDIQATQVLAKDAINLFLVHTKLTQVQDEVKKIHFENKESEFMSSVKIGSLVCIIMTCFVTVSLTASKKNFTEADLDDEKFLSPISTSRKTASKKLKRELSSLDKKNIFPSTVNTVMVQKNGMLKEVKRTMRFSPEIQRFTPSRMTATPPSLKKVTSNKQRPKYSTYEYSGGSVKSPGIFSPRFQKMKVLKEEDVKG